MNISIKKIDAALSDRLVHHEHVCAAGHVYTIRHDISETCDRLGCDRPLPDLCPIHSDNVKETIDMDNYNVSPLNIDDIRLNGIAIDWHVKRDGDLFCPVCSTERGNRSCRPANFTLALTDECACCGLNVGESEGLLELRKENA